MLLSSAYLTKRCPRRSSSRSSSSSTRLLSSGERGPPCGVPSTLGLTSPFSITPVFTSREAWGSRPLLLVEEHRDVTDEQFGILVQRAVRRIGITDQLSVRQILLQDVRVDRVDDDIVAAVDDKRRLFDFFQIIPSVFTFSAPFGDCRALRQRRFLGHFGIAIFGAEPKALEKFASGRLARFRRREVNAKPKIVRALIGRAEDLFAFRRTGIHALAAARSSADQHQAVDEIGGLQRDFLCDETADREAQPVNLLEPERFDETDRVGAHLRERARNIA